MECVKCNKRYGQFSKCEGCKYMLCLDCDNTTTILNWVDIDDKDYYLCEKCRLKHIIPSKNEIITNR